MNSILVKLLPYLLILCGLFVLFFINNGAVAGVPILIGIVMILESIWPERWGEKD